MVGCSDRVHYGFQIVEKQIIERAMIKKLGFVFRVIASISRGKQTMKEDEEREEKASVFW